MIRMSDLTLALCALIAISPLFLALVVVLRLTGEGEVFYRQRGSVDSKVYVLKFATMLKDSPNMGLGTITVQNDPRILPLGHFCENKN